jgi:ankyrin repeat protein
VKQEWIDHENQHRRVWHCHSHEAEFETQPEYLEHLKEQHPENEWEHYTPDIIAAVVGASAKPHRDCPFCPTRFSDVKMMQKHVRYHLERLALYALPDIGEDNDDELASERTSDSHQVIENRGRKDSIRNDFVEGLQAFLAAFAKDDSGRDEPTKGSALLSEANLQLTELSPHVPWLDTYLASQPLDEGADVEAEDGGFGRTPLLLAAEEGHEAVVRQLLDQGAAVNSKDDDYGRTPLSWAAENGHEAVVKLLLDTGKVDVDARGEFGRTPLSWAAENGHEAVVKLLLDTGKVDVDARDKSGRTPLLWAAENGHEAVAKLLPGTEGLLSHIKKVREDWWATFDQTVPRVLDVDLVHTLQHESVVCCVRFSSDGKYVATGCNHSAQIYDVATGEKICVLQDDGIDLSRDLYTRSVCFSPDSKYLATGSESKLIRVSPI